jgi:hypothetical protein
MQVLVLCATNVQFSTILYYTIRHSPTSYPTFIYIYIQWKLIPELLSNQPNIQGATYTRRLLLIMSPLHLVLVVVVVLLLTCALI